MWGIFESEEIDNVGLHVIPCDEEGNMQRGHTLEWHCSCGPEISDITIHNMRH